MLTSERINPAGLKASIDGHSVATRAQAVPGAATSTYGAVAAFTASCRWLAKDRMHVAQISRPGSRRKVDPG